MFQTKKLLPLLLFSFLIFTGCIKASLTDTTHNTLPPEYTVSESDFKSRVSGISSSEDIRISTSVTESTYKPTVHAFNIDLINPGNFPVNTGAFLAQTEQIREEAQQSIRNIGKFNRIKIDVRQVTQENGTEKVHSYKKEIEL